MDILDVWMVRCPWNHEWTSDSRCMLSWMSKLICVDTWQKQNHKHAMLVDPVTGGPQTCKNIFGGPWSDVMCIILFPRQYEEYTHTCMISALSQVLSVIALASKRCVQDIHYDRWHVCIVLGIFEHIYKSPGWPFFFSLSFCCLLAHSNIQSYFRVNASFMDKKCK